MRKAIARVLTVLNDKRKTTSKDAVAKKKYRSKDLRMKKTRVWRRKLTKFESSRRTNKQQKKDGNF